MAEPHSSPFKEGLLQGKVALLSGGGTGITFQIAASLAQHGAAVAICGRREAILRDACAQLTSKGFDAMFAVCDVRKPEQAEATVQAVVQRFGRIDILVNGAAGNFLCAAEDLSYNAFKAVVEVDLLGTFNMSRAAFQELAKAKGMIMNISATLHYGATPYQAHPSAAKAGVDALTRSLAEEWGEYGIRVVGIAPGPIGGTEGIERLVPADMRDELVQRIPLRRLGSVEDIGLAAVFLASSAAAYITGTTLVVDGGSWLSRPRVVPKEQLRSFTAARRKSTPHVSLPPPRKSAL